MSKKDMNCRHIIVTKYLKRPLGQIKSADCRCELESLLGAAYYRHIGFTLIPLGCVCYAKLQRFYAH